MSLIQSNIFWFGNLNSTLQKFSFDNMNQETFNFQKEVDLYDELLGEMRRGSVFQGFEEPKIIFPPTMNGKKSKLSPSYNNRILYFSQKVYNIYYYHMLEFGLATDPVFIRFTLDFSHILKTDKTIDEYSSDLKLFDSVKYIKLASTFKNEILSIEKGEIVHLIQTGPENKYEYKDVRFRSKTLLEGDEVIPVKDGNGIRFTLKSSYTNWTNFLSSEKNYVRYLKLVVEKFKIPLEGILEPKIHKNIFHSFSLIYEISSKFLKNLIDASNHSNSELLSKSINEFLKEFKSFIPYIENYQIAFQTLNEERAKNSKFSKFLQTNSLLLMKYGIDDIQSLLILPIQRFSIYKEVFEKLVMYAPEKYRDEAKIVFDDFKQILQIVNEKTKDSEKFLDLYLIQKRYDLTFNNNQEVLFQSKKNEEIYLFEFDKTVLINDMVIMKNYVLITIKNKKHVKEFRRFTIKPLDTKSLYEIQTSQKKLKNIKGFEINTEGFVLNIITENENILKRLESKMEKLLNE